MGIFFSLLRIAVNWKTYRPKNTKKVKKKKSHECIKYMCKICLSLRTTKFARILWNAEIVKKKRVPVLLSLFLNLDDLTEIVLPNKHKNRKYLVKNLYETHGLLEYRWFVVRLSCLLNMERMGKLSFIQSFWSDLFWDLFYLAER